MTWQCLSEYLDHEPIVRLKLDTNVHACLENNENSQCINCILKVNFGHDQIYKLLRNLRTHVMSSSICIIFDQGHLKKCKILTPATGLTML